MGLYIQMHSMHGLFRSKNLELGRDEDTGGQIVYVLELAKALGEFKDVDRIEIITRRIVDPDYPGYSKKIEDVSFNVRIVRIECGHTNRYMKKVCLWPYIDQFTENVKKYIERIKRKPDILHSNYADSGLVCAKLSRELRIPQVHTGHSLGIPKMRRLGVTERNIRRFNRIYHFDRRLAAENATIRNASAIVASTREEVREQYRGYKIKDAGRFVTIAPGIDLKRFHPSHVIDEKREAYTRQLLENCIMQGLKHPERTPVAVLTRLDRRKNLLGLLKAFALDKEFQRLANIVIFAKTLQPAGETQPIIDRINFVLRKYNLYDNVCLPGINLEYEKQVPAFYRWLRENSGIFVNPALIEPFGLTVVEASACGVPVCATRYGGPSEYLTDGENGLLIDPVDRKDIARKVKRLIRDRALYRKISRNAVRLAKQNFTWKSSARKYLELFRRVVRDAKASGN